MIRVQYNSDTHAACVLNEFTERLTEAMHRRVQALVELNMKKGRQAVIITLISPLPTELTAAFVLFWYMIEFWIAMRKTQREMETLRKTSHEARRNVGIYIVAFASTIVPLFLLAVAMGDIHIPNLY